MEDIEKMIAEISVTNFEVESMHWVEITYITDPLNFYARPNKFKALVQHFESLKPSIKPTSVNIEDLILFSMEQSFEGEKFARGRIISSKKVKSILKFDIFAIDYGTIKREVPLKHIWTCDEKFKTVPPLAINCQLANCFPVGVHGWPTDTIDAFKFYVGYEQAKMKILGTTVDKFIVELVNTNPDDIATLLAIAGYSRLGSNYDSIKWKPTVVRQKLYYSFKDLNINETLHVRVLSGKSLKEFYVAEVNDYEKHLKEIDIITFYARREFKISNEDMIEDELVCVKDDERNIYERALFKKITIPDSKAFIKYVDTGIEAEVPVDKLKYMSALCLRTPVLAIFCSTEESQVWDNGHEGFLSPGFEFLITIKEIGSQFDRPNIVDMSPLEICSEETEQVEQNEQTEHLEQEEQTEQAEEVAKPSDDIAK